MRYDYDVIVVGAGPAGSSTALYSAQKGLKVLLVDRGRFPREKICGDGLSRDCFPHLRELGVLSEVERSVHADIKTAVLVAPNGRSVRVEIPAPLYVCRRRIFDDILFQAARQKVDSLEGCTVRNVLMEGGRVCGIEGHRSEKKSVSFTARVIVGADGVHSVLSRKAPVPGDRPKRWMAGVRAYCTGIPDLQDAVEFYFIRGFLPGYFWIFPTGDGCANIGLCLLHGGKSESPLHLRGAFQAAMNSPSVRKRLQGARILGEIRGDEVSPGRRPASCGRQRVSPGGGCGAARQPPHRGRREQGHALRKGGRRGSCRGLPWIRGPHDRSGGIREEALG